MSRKVQTYDNPNDDPRYRQGEAIKERLAEFFHQRKISDGLSTYTLREQLYKETQMDFTENTISATITPGSKPAPNFYVVIGLCRLWKLDYATILAPADTIVKVAPTDTALMAKTEILTDSGYLDTYYGYMYTKNLNHKEICSFTLKIDERNGCMQATMKTISHPNNVAGEKTLYTREFSGTPIVLTKPKTVFMMLSDYQGDFITLFFEFRHYNTKDGMYFRKGILISSEASSDKPIVENFVLFKRELSADNISTYIPGLLKLTYDTFVVTEDDVQELLRDEDFAKSYAKYSYLFDGKQKNCFQFKTSQFITAIQDKYNQEDVNEAMKVVLRLKAKALEADRIEYSNPEGLPSFTKSFLQR